MLSGKFSPLRRCLYLILLLFSLTLWFYWLGVFDTGLEKTICFCSSQQVCGSLICSNAAVMCGFQRPEFKKLYRVCSVPELSD